MKSEIGKNALEKASAVLQALSDKGAFLITGGQKPNIMTIGWGSMMMMWGTPLMSVVVRQSRYSHQLLAQDPRFTVSLPSPGELLKELAICGTKSGRDVDKFELCSLQQSAPKGGGICGIADCALNIECSFIHTIHMPTQGLPDALKQRYYPLGDEHTMYFGEILAIY